MTPNWNQAIGALAIDVLSGAVACVSTPADAEDAGPATVGASDGTLELSFPLSALPEGVAPSDLSITTLAPIEVIDPFDPEAAVVAATSREIARFDLQPAGLHFEQPVKVSARLPVTGPLFAYLISDDGTAAVLPVSTTLEGETVVATTEVEHFSEIVWSVAGFAPFSVWAAGGTFVVSEPIAVGETLDLDFIAARPKGGQVELRLIGYTADGGPAVRSSASYIVDVGTGPWQLRGVFGNRSEEVLSPAFDPEPPGEWVVGSEQLLSTHGQFTCTQPGDWTVTFVGGPVQLRSPPRGGSAVWMRSPPSRGGCASRRCHRTP
jgi:hypothetical protein